MQPTDSHDRPGQAPLIGLKQLATGVTLVGPTDGEVVYADASLGARLRELRSTLPVGELRDPALWFLANEVRLTPPHATRPARPRQ